jgi:ketosteroid isomerase-like protein
VRLPDETTRLVRELADRAAIAELAARYASALDTHDWPALAGLFTEDATWEYPSAHLRHVGPSAIVAAIREPLERLDGTQHLVGNQIVVLDGDSAEHQCYTQAQHVRAGAVGGNLFTSGVRYVDRLRRDSDGWRFHRRVLKSMWRSGNPVVLTGPAVPRSDT